MLGIKKYTDLRANLLNTRLRLREKSAHKSDRDKLNQLQKQVVNNDKQLEHFKQEIMRCQEDLVAKKSLSDNYQIQLIREDIVLLLHYPKSKLIKYFSKQDVQVR